MALFLLLPNHPNSSLFQLLFASRFHVKTRGFTAHLKDSILEVRMFLGKKNTDKMLKTETSTVKETQGAKLND